MNTYTRFLCLVVNLFIYQCFYGMTLEHQLFNSVKSDDFNQLCTLVVKGADITAQRAVDGATILHRAIVYHRVPMIYYMLNICQMDANALTFDQCTPLHIAAFSSSPREIVRLLLNAGADCNRKGGTDQITPLLIATYEGASDVVDELLTNHADTTIDSIHPFKAAIDGNNYDVIHTYLRHGFDAVTRNSCFGGRTCLEYCLPCFFPKEFLLRRHGYLYDRENFTGIALTKPLPISATIRLLMQYGAQLPETYTFLYEQLFSDPLVRAVVRGDEKGFDDLLDQNADQGSSTQQPSTSRMPLYTELLYHAVSQGHPNIVDKLLQRGARPRVISTDGQKPFTESAYDLNRLLLSQATQGLSDEHRSYQQLRECIQRLFAEVRVVQPARPTPVRYEPQRSAGAEACSNVIDWVQRIRSKALSGAHNY